jgi:hypothetical protein
MQTRRWINARGMMKGEFKWYEYVLGLGAILSAGLPIMFVIAVGQAGRAAGPRQSRGLHRMSECAWRWNLAPGLDQRGRVA